MSDVKRVEKVQKLLNLAGRAGTPEEAEAALTRAQELMTKWAIDDAALAAHGENADDKIIDEYVFVPKSVYFDDVCKMWGAIGAANGVQTLISPIMRWYNGQGVWLVGWKSDVERVKMLFSVIHAQCRRERNKQLPVEYRVLGTPKQISDWKCAFTAAYGFRIGARLLEQVERTKHEATDANPDLLPVLVSRDEKVKNRAEELSHGEYKHRTKYDENGYAHGHHAANRADLGNIRVDAGDQLAIEA